MDDGFDKFVDELQEEINKEVRREYSPNVLDLITRKPNNSPMRDANARGSSKDDTGKFITVFLKVNASFVIENATYTTNGCKTAFASGSQVTLLVKGKTIEQAKAIDAMTISQALGKMPEEYPNYIELAAQALQAALGSGERIKAAKGKKL
ncbi:MAG TPA: iron-sulfur cluster assembly scaffold protein [Candidatus Lokiarchaeia archaeon]|nr:iron-sulfur cluster assembly scaffold protein [Candidatus Lokiarchaeia archaeon]